MALSGVPFFFSGGWTKEEILHATANWPRSHLPYYLMLGGVVLTALYMTRQMIYVFFGKPRVAAERAHESPHVMTMPLIVLALGAILLSVVLTPAWPWLHDYLIGEPVHFEFGRLIQPMLFISLVLVGAGIAVGFWMYRKAGLPDRGRPAEVDPLEYAQPALFRFLANGIWIDELYDRTVIAFSWMARVYPIGWIAISGMAWCADSAVSVSSLGSLQRVSMSAGSMPESMRRPRARAVWTPDVSGALRPNSNLPRRGGDWNASAAPSVRMAGLITTTIFVPLLGAIAVTTWPRGNFRGVALIFTALAAACALGLWRDFDTALLDFSWSNAMRDPCSGRRISRRRRWFEPALGVAYVINYSVRISGASTSTRRSRILCDHAGDAVGPLRDVHCAEFRSVVFVLRDEPDSRVSAHQNLGGENRDYAATKFFLYTFLGSVAMLLSFLGIYFAKRTFDFAVLTSMAKSGLLSGSVAWLAFAGIFLGLAVKVPLFPFHTWLPDAYQTAPTGVSMC